QRVRRHIRRRNRRLAQVLPPPPSKQSISRILSKPIPYIPQTKRERLEQQVQQDSFNPVAHLYICNVRANIVEGKKSSIYRRHSETRCQKSSPN
ncbi:hypothetical protein TSAR_011768, partial [Trichomalopsis sarcophagae]